MEITKRVNTYQTDLYCDKCGINTTATVDYPVISYEEVDE